MKPFYTLEKIAFLRRCCRRWHLEGAENLDRHDDASLLTICNGIGPDSWPGPLRRAATLLRRELEPAAMLHDLDYHTGGSLEQFHAANQRLKRNGVLTAQHLYRWYDPRRWLLCRRACRCAFYCERFGIGAWESAQR